jgi:hypothetical protein
LHADPLPVIHASEQVIHADPQPSHLDASHADESVEKLLEHHEPSAVIAMLKQQKEAATEEERVQIEEKIQEVVVHQEI